MSLPLYLPPPCQKAVSSTSEIPIQSSSLSSCLPVLSLRAEVTAIIPWRHYLIWFEVVQEEGPSALPGRNGTIVPHLAEGIHFFLLGAFLTASPPKTASAFHGHGDDPLQFCDVSIPVEEDALGRLPVSPSPPCLLEVSRHRLGQRHVKDEPHVRFVDTHPVRDRRTYHVQGPSLPATLDDVPLSCRLARVVVVGLDPRCDKVADTDSVAFFVMQ
eukprot:CAMPEP_0185779514 /NCGR_PEP_ID=MMETSP1174-20130828/96057_1 /TAXON_ID=35687 /ORGANISM="Dictyocha speculum, Strain CCMP1381" /LENGTH=214 /DNA_ID=CAMNT_0028468703 /DNA_START=51 /DNA_END=696 /DNA_ORIENTATION=-